MWDPREDSYIQELAARIEALEAAQQLAGTDHADWHRLSDVKPLNGAECLFRLYPNRLHSRGVWFDQSHSLTPSVSPSGFYTDCGLFVGDPALIWWSAIEPEAQQPATAPPAPAGELVKRVAHLLAMRFSESRPSADCTPFACDVLREVAAATDQMAPDRNLTWERVALWLEREANQ